MVLRSGAALGVVIISGFAMAAMQWLPLIEYANHSGASVVRQERLAAQPFISTDPRYLVGILFPYANGFPDGVMPFEIRKATNLPNTNELAPGWVGTIPLVLGIFAAIVLRKRFATVKLWATIGIVAANSKEVRHPRRFAGESRLDPAWPAQQTEPENPGQQAIHHGPNQR